ncbi:amino acid adenylation domain-containing protein [Chitinophaga sp. G-6-1-13]|uniref:Amino acid adenylation domain-containing protein n=1 Tax=Chitinophaga fulva TaxID=2728842 RepID=A0A848GJJ8_9BACT|nr:non-ribosomal peptide synthetase [Chitinophaga fulva]NML37861.1 amino acid adenylation domain-containing protein [Chitinophaga fulva]
MDKKVIHSVFEEVVKNNPSRIAIETVTGKISYAGLNIYANRIAALLKHIGCKKGTIVNVLGQSSIQLVAAMLGVFKSGGIYLPVDAQFSTKRLAQIFEETFDGIIIVDAVLQEVVPVVMESLSIPFACYIVADQEGNMSLYEWKDGHSTPVDFKEEAGWQENPPLLADGRSSNYIFYTSGSTGKAKAIEGAHAGLSHFIHWELKEFNIADNVRVSQITQFTFDASLRDVFVGLIAGGTVCIPDADTKANPAALLQWLADNRITLIHCVPSLFRVLVKEMEWSDRQYDLSALQYLMMAGEMLYTRDISEWRKLAGDHVQIVNLYGPTETTMVKSFFRIGTLSDSPSQSIPVGIPISNTNIAVIKDGYICSAGEIGEIYIKTPFATKGYYKNETLTKEFFVQNPLSNDAEDIVYKTGDLGRYLSDGNIEVLGRLDSQVKVNGVRVELIEVERALLALDGIHQTVVKAHRTDDNLTSLIAYYTGMERDVETFRSQLEQSLNTQLIPSYFIHLEAFPLNVNGKIDRRALPVPEEVVMGGASFEAPSGTVEEKLETFWKEILGYNRISRNISFFSIGGHSLRAIQLVSRIQHEFNVVIRIADVFTENTIRKQAAFIAAGLSAGAVAIQPTAPQPHYALSSAQRRLWVLCQFEDGSMAYNMPGAYVIEGSLNVALLKAAFDGMIARHEILRTVFGESQAGEIRQFILSPEEIAFDIPYEDIRNLADQEQRISSFLDAESRYRFQLAKGPLLRATLFRVEDERWVLSYMMHHIISDDWSMQVLLRELFAIYHAAITGNEAGLPPLPVQYKDYAAWQQEQLREDALTTHRTYWMEQFSGELPVLQLPADHPRPAVKTYHGDIIYSVIDKDLSERLKTFLQERGDTLFMGLMTVINVLLHRYTGQRDIVIGSPVAARAHLALEDQIGFYTNILPLRTRFSSDITFVELLEEVRQLTLAAFRHEVFPFDQLIDELKLKRDMSRAPLFDVFVDLHDRMATADIAAGIENAGLRIKPLEDGQHHVSKFDLTWMFTNTDKEIYMSLEYNTDIYTGETARRYCSHFLQLLEALITEPFVPVAQADYLHADEKQLLLETFNRDRAAVPAFRAIPALLAAQVTVAPEAAAIVFDNQPFSYQQVNEAANRLAAYLAGECAVRRGDRVGIMLDRSEKMIVAMLGILKAGAVYVPVDPAYPEIRKAAIVEDAALKVLITQTNYLFDITYFNGPLFAIDVQLDTLAGVAWEDVPVMPEEPAYVLYTSGSTGNPKGCEITHGSLSHYVQWACEYYVSGKAVRGNFPLFTSLSFDLTVTSIFCPLISGATVYVYGQEKELPDILQHCLGIDSGVDCIKLTPSHVRLLEALEIGASGIGCAILGGEAVMVEHVAALKQLNNHMRVYNEYGPTETTVGCVVKELEASGPVLIGKPVSGAEICILDAFGQLVPVGVYGEICIGGAGLARGYLNRADLTEEKFIAHPYREGKRLYRSGDSGRWQANGELACQGRIDDQVKVRGYRIEPGEIEHALSACPGITACAVKAWPQADGEVLLAGYLEGDSHDTERVRAFLSTRLPAYMLPQQLISVPVFPLTVNGKTDRHALPAPQADDRSSGKTYVAARNETETVLIAVFEEVLKKQGIGVLDDFFMLGGDSIKSIQIVARLKQRGYTLTIQEVLQYTTISVLADYVKVLVREADQSPVSGMIPLSPIQHWFFEVDPEHVSHFNQSVLLESQEPLSELALKATLDRLVQHHDALRMVFRETASGWEQENKNEHQGCSLEILTWGDEAAFTADCERIQSSVDLSTGPLLRAGLFRGAGKDRLLLVVHHLVMDAVSWRILLEDLSSVYQALSMGISAHLPAKTDSFLYWQQQQLAYAVSDALQQETLYWDAIENRAVAGLVPDHAGGSNLMQDIETVGVQLSAATTECLLTRCYQAYGTEINDILLAALGLAVQEVFGSTEILVRLEGHGREYIGSDVDVTRTVGWFTTMYPVLLDLTYARDPVRQLIAVKESLHRVPGKGIGYGILRYLCGRPYQLQPQIGFNYLGDFGTVLQSEASPSAFTFSGAHRGREMPGTRQRDLLLEVSGMVADDVLRLSIDYSREQFEAATINRLSAALQRHLEWLADRLSGTTRRQLTPVDLSYTSLTVDQVMGLQQEKAVEDIYPLSPFQEGLYYHWLSSPGSPLYFEQMSYRLKGLLDLSLLEQSYYTLVSRHAVLRTHFTQHYGERLLQVVCTDIREGFSVYRPSGESEAAVSLYREQDRLRGFDLHKGSQMRLAVIALEEDVYEFVWSHHHIIMDGWCVSLLVKEFFQIYESLKVGRPAGLGRVYPYSGYIQWLEGLDRNHTREYWRHYLEGYDTVSTIPRMKAPGRTFRGNQQTLLLDGALRTSIRSVCTTAGVTESTFIQAVWGILLGKYNDREDVVFGTVVSGRPAQLEGMEEMIGLFSNAIPVRIRPEKNLTVRSLLKTVQRMWIGSADHHYMQLAEIQAASTLGRNLMDHMLVFENYPVVEAVEETMENVRNIAVLGNSVFGQANYDLMITVIARDSIVIKFDYNESIYENDQVERMISHLKGIIHAMIENIDENIGTINYISQEEHRLLLETFNDTTVAYPSEGTLVSLFREQVQSCPDAPALVFMEETLSYAVLDERSDRLADYLLQAHQLKHGERVGILMGRSDRLIVAILGILKAGGCFVPIDPEYPEQRRSFIIRDAGIQVLITEADHIFNLEHYSGALIALDLQLDTMPAAGQLPEVSATTAAYVIYTSGSTGTPKGVVIEHHAIVNTIRAQRAAFELDGHERGLQFASPSFDASVWEIFMMLATGGTLYVVDEESRKTPELLEAYIHQHEIDIATLPPAYLKLLDASRLGLRKLITAGEAAIMGDAMAFSSHGTYYNAYGPAESSICATIFRVEQGSGIPYSSVPVGKPIANTQVYILNKDQQLMPVGVYGEICLGGAGLAQGYLDRPDLTSERFIAHPYQAGERLYRTGDVGRWLSDGNVEFGGRMDAQVKLHGYRIETGEIEHVLESYEGISGAVVKLWTSAGGDAALVAYLEGADHDVRAVRDYLSSRLPTYMVPHHFISLASFPVTVNGKTDRQALPSPESVLHTSDVAYVSGRNDKEIQLIAVFEEVLKKSPLGIYDDFFLLGGDSIKSIQIVSRLKQRGYMLGIQDVMRSPVIAELAGSMQPLTREADQSTVTGQTGLGPVQQWFLQTSSEWGHYNQSVLLESRERLSEPSLRASLDHLLLHHDALRMVYHHKAGVWEQENLGSEQGCLLEVHDWTDDTSFGVICDRIQSTIDLENGPLFRAALFRGTDKDRLLLVAHHLVIDGVSWRILFDDLAALYEQYRSGVTTALPLKTDSFRDWQQQLYRYADSTALAEEAAYWSAVEATAVTPLPVDHPDGSNKVQDMTECAFTLDTKLTNDLLTRCYKAYNTEINDILLTALGLAMQEVFNTSTVLLQLEGHGREYIGEEMDVTRTVGWFTSIYPVVLDMRYTTDVVQQLIAVKEMLQGIPGKGIGYGILRYVTGHPYKLAPEISFNYLGDFGSGAGTAQDGASLFSFSGAYHGQETPADRQRDTLLDVTGIVVAGNMELSVRYSQQQYDAATIASLVESYRRHLEMLIHTLSVHTDTLLTPSDLTWKELSVQEVMTLQKEVALEDVYPLSPLQEGLYYHWAASPASPVYFEQMSYRMKADLDIQVLEKSYYALISRHAVLRTHFSQHFGERTLQIVVREIKEGFSAIRATGDTEDFIRCFKEDDRMSGFNLSKGSQMRLTVIDLGAEMYEFVWSHHHIIMDGWCVSVLVKDFFTIYDSLLAGGRPLLPEVHPYATYIQLLSNVNREEALSYWSNYLNVYDTPATLPRMKAREEDHRGCREVLQLDATLMASVRNICQTTGITESTFIQAAWGILLNRYNNTDDAVFGAVVSGRPAELKGIEEMIGLFSNTVPVRVRLSEDETVLALLKKMQQAATMGSHYHYVQLAEVQAATTLGRNLFDHILVFENFPVTAIVKDNVERKSAASNWTFIAADGFDRSNYDMTITIHPGTATELLFSYNGAVYTEQLMLQVKQHLLQIVRQMAADVDIRTGDIDILSSGEKILLTAGFNDTATTFPYLTVMEMFEACVAATPDQTALTFEGGLLSYHELNEQAIALAAYLTAKHSVKAGDLVGIKLPRNEWLIVSILGILKAGAAYLPIDITYPEQRIQYLTRDGNCRLVIDEEEIQHFRGDNIPVLRTSHTATPDSTAYIIYTSGSTGQPKGCMISHASLANYIQWANSYYFKDGCSADFGLFTSVSFDLTVTSIFCSLTTGRTLHIYGQEEDLLQVLAHSFSSESGIQSIKLTPAHINILKDLPVSSSAMKCAIVGGEEVKSEHVRILKNISPGIKVYNEYGPTETTVGCVVKELNGEGPVLIGKPVANTRILICDHALRLCPPGVRGEIYIGGAGVAKGYRNQPAITAAKFVPDPRVPGERLYKTGDAGCWQADGEIVFLGRMDDQIKIRGYRVEPGEIETLLQDRPEIDAAVVIAAGDAGSKYLVAYVTGKKTIDPEALKLYLAALVPEFMVPSHVLQLPAIPMTVNGKTDKERLLAYYLADQSPEKTYVPPGTPLEERVLQIWRELLGIEKISVEDNFFTLGGHSLNAMKLLAQLHKEFNVIIKVKEFFGKATIREIGKEIQRTEWLRNKQGEPEDNLISEKNFTL